MVKKKIPKFIYHYTKAINFLLILPLMRLKMGRIEATNDPKEKIRYFEVMVHGDYFDPKDERIEIIEDFLNNYPSITCFSAGDAHKNGFDLPTMWAHYADNHKGICLELNTHKFLYENNPNFIFDNVDYALTAEYNKFSITKNTTKKEILKKLVFLKRDDWSSENEWRLFSLEGEDFCSIKESLESIILGLDFNDEKYLELIKLFIPTKTKIKKIVLDESTQKFGVKTVN
ncbi:MAG: DUF2971 domain-containing protein [Bacteroidales bacterium]|nr:DUF2971 domain-containing protein [Bacteroidales bacterium]